MVNAIGSVQTFVVLLLSLGSLALTGFAAIDALRRPSRHFPAVGRLSKPAWVGILGAAFLLAIVLLANPLGFLNVLGVVAAGVYLAEVRPKLKAMGGGGSSSSGPYGPW
jgi:hypothetical protein